MSSLLAKTKRLMKGIMLKSMPGMITCRQFESFIVDYLEGSLAERERTLFERHIRLCRECREYLDAYQLTNKLSAALKASPEDEVPASVPQDLIDAVRAARDSRD